MEALAVQIKYENNTKNNRDVFAETCSSIISSVISFFILILVLIFPLIINDSYFDILETKYRVYWVSIVAMLVLCLVLSLIMMVIDIIENEGRHAKELFLRLRPKHWRDTFGLADMTVLIFFLILIISTLQSEYVYEAFWGNEGRYTGLFLLSLYISSYFLISRFWHVKGWLPGMFLLSGMVICLIGITDYFQLDILGFRSGDNMIDPVQSTMFTSTLGNINTYTAYVALVMGFSGMMFATAKNHIHLVGYFICMVISFMAIILGCSDNAYLALAALFGFAPIVLFNNRLGMKRYLVMVASFFSVVQLIDWINQKFADTVIGLDSLFQVIVTFKWLLWIVVILWLVVAGIYYFDKKNNISNLKENKRFVNGWVVFISLSILVIIVVFCDANFFGHADRYERLANYLVFNDDWGTRRGYIWRRSIEMYKDFTSIHKWFGYGPDTFGILTTNTIRNDMINTTGQLFDNAHNEYLQYFITIGPIGLFAYLVFLISSIVRMCRNKKVNPYIIGCCFAVICYLIQALVNLSLPIATPMMWLLLSIGAAGCRRDSDKEMM